MSNIKVNAILDADGGTTATVNGYTPTASNMAGRNRIINGAMVIAQRGSVAAVNSTYTYGGADRIACSVNNLSSGWIQQLQSPVAGGVSGYCQAVQATTAGAGEVYFRTCIENLNTLDLNSRSVTIRCKVFQDSGASVNVRLELDKPTTTENTFSATTNLATTTISVPNYTLTTITLTYTLGAAEASLGLAAIVVFPLGSAVTGNYFTVTDWQLEKGSTATDFEYRPYGTELALCQRYYEHSVPVFIRGTVANAAGAVGTTAYFKVTKREVPTLAPYGTLTNLNVSSESIGEITSEGFQYQMTIINANSDFYLYGRLYSVSAEL